MVKITKDKEASPKLQKLVLLIFGLGPIFIMGWFLTSQGFFSTPGT
ncbi:MULTISPECIES: hypothetical protein [Prochlorococcus]|nr:MULTISPECIES: hypothetical protein [Prochlorococcus]KGG10189.1 hypothetical protein EV04_2013 [Prochlorococcus marinus str. LG]KGG22217.1 hypothetical protein EV08_0393 [Prochlorococcus marinus str. SS2]KGG24466.1 hypothetical protein EV09_0096 [Prochlorococcus marinus str. SS35]KGG33361.1 hypothetical protein EV10_0568 [Prochlorococcus marinus str. SS51]KGG35502.1 hypothetical protein EV11_1303 [Prochlorococcus sp. SS52]